VGTVRSGRSRGGVEVGRISAAGGARSGSGRMVMMMLMMMMMSRVMVRHDRAKLW
jgi:hypothetical protein